MWTQFHDMHSGGGLKENWGYIYIEADNDEAQIIFQNKFGHNPNRVTCTCCGNDYSISSGETLERVSAYERKDYSIYNPIPPYYDPAKVIPLEEYLKDENCLFIYEKDILPEWREGSLKDQGYIWVD